MRPDELAPKDLFSLQGEAWKAGDMNAVKEMGEVARSRIKFPDQNEWQHAKNIIDGMEFPAEKDFTETFSAETHDQKKGTHVLQTYKHWFDVLGFEAEAKYNICKKCNETRNSVIRIYNNKLGVVYEKWFKWQGENVEGKDILKVARDLFAN